MDLQLQNKTALVTGSTAGIGLAIVEALAREGAEVIINGRTSQRVEKAIASIRKTNGAAKLHGVAADLSTAAGADLMIAEVPRLDILVNNMGIFEPKPFAEIPDSDWLRFFETNVLSGIRLARHYFPRMLSANWGRVIFISSESAVQIPAEMIHYGMTKTAQIAVARGMAELTKGTGVTVNSILAGPTKSEGVETFVSRMAASRGVDQATIERDFFASVRPTSLLKRFEQPAEIAQVVAFVASALASGINGAAIRAEGGVVQAAL